MAVEPGWTVEEMEDFGTERPDGTFNTFDAPGAGKGVLQGTTPQSINSAGAITGASINAANGFHGFLRTPDGTITEFNAPGAAKGTSALSINSVGTITGFYIDANGVIHGFLRSVPFALQANSPLYR